MYHIHGYYDRRYSGLAESTTARSIGELPDIVWSYLNHGNFVKVVNDRNGKCIRFDPEELETMEFGLDASDFRGLSGPVRKVKTPMDEVNKAFAESKKQIKL